ncbi:MAG: hypothetical protein HKM95_17965 [Inquilinus sp.]|nr:hypothetical protein [Inquilinus sp.]
MKQEFVTAVWLGMALIGAQTAGSTANAETIAGPDGFPAMTGVDLTATVDDTAGIGTDRLFAGPVVGFREPGTGDGSLIGHIGLLTATRLESSIGPVDTQLSVSLEQPLGIVEQAGGDHWNTARRNLSFEEIDATDLRLEHALSLRLRGRVDGLFDYESRIRLRSSGIREVSARIRIKW